MTNQVKVGKNNSINSGEPESEPFCGKFGRLFFEYAQSLLYITMWICTSAGVILFNKYILARTGFKYPITLTACHMGFGSILGFLLCRVFKVFPTLGMSAHDYLKFVVPIGVLFAVVLSLSNSAYLYLSVSFIQMLKASMPVVVYFTGVALKKNKLEVPNIINLLVISGGVALASGGELKFVLLGFVFQMSSIVLEGIRLLLVQILLQDRGWKMGPFQTVYYVAPSCFMALLPVACILELDQIFAQYQHYQHTSTSTIHVKWWELLLNALLAFALNCCSFLLIGKTSALTMNVAGVVKDWILIGLSVLIFHSLVSKLNLIGYSIAFIGVAIWNYRKILDGEKKKKEPAEEKMKQVADESHIDVNSAERKGLLQNAK